MWCRVVCWDATDREDGGDMFLRTVGCISTDYTASHPRRWYSSTIASFQIPSNSLFTIHPTIPHFRVWATDSLAKYARTKRNNEGWRNHFRDVGRRWGNPWTCFAAWTVPIWVFIPVIITSCVIWEFIRVITPGARILLFSLCAELRGIL
jgi:hypothetical protein